MSDSELIEFLRDMYNQHRFGRYIDPLTKSNPIESASRARDLPAVKFFHSQGTTITPKTLEYAIRANSLECLVYLLDNCDAGLMSEKLYLYALETESFEIVKYLHGVGCPWSAETLHEASRCRNPELFVFLCENGCPIDRKSIAHGVSQSMIKVQCAIKNGLQLHEDLPYYASVEGNVEVLKYLLSIGCPIDVNDCLQTADANKNGGCRPFLQSLLQARDTVDQCHE